MIRQVEIPGVNRGHFAKLAFAILAIAALAVALVLASPFEGKDYDLVVLSLIGTGAMAVSTWLGKASKTLDFFEPVVVVFAMFVVFYPLRLLFSVVLDDELLAMRPSTLRLALLTSVVGFVAFTAGYRSVLGRRVGQRVGDALCRFDGDWNLRRATFFSAFCLIIALASLCALYILRGSFVDFLIVDPAHRARSQVPYWYTYLGWGVSFVVVGAVFQLALFLKYRRQGLYTGLYFLTAILLSPLTGRYIPVGLLLMAAGVLNYLHKKWGLVRAVLLGMLVTILLVVGGTVRDMVSFPRELYFTTLRDAVAVHVVLGLDHMKMLGLLLEDVPQVVGWQYGSTFLGIPIKALPGGMSSPFPKAQVIINEAFFPARFEEGFAMTATMLGEWYLNFSWAGIVLGMALAGMTAAALWSLKGKDPSPGRVLIYVACIYGLASWVRNDVQVASSLFGMHFLPTLVGLLFVLRPKQPDKRAP